MEREGKRLVARLISDSNQSLLLLEARLADIQPELLELLGLSHREAEVLAWIARGKTNADVGTILGISAETVKKHLDHIYQKLLVETRTAAIAKVYRIASTLRR